MKNAGALLPPRVIVYKRPVSSPESTSKAAPMPTLDPSTAPQVVRDWLELVRPEIDEAIARYIALYCAGQELDKPMRYAALGSGKRLRPALTIAACVATGGDRRDALPAAAAIEMLHAYTLVHDDLPAMDDDTMRRGRPTVHVEFGEAIAILAGDGLLTAAFGALAELGPRAGDAVAVLARRAGAGELLAGQARDLALEAVPRPISLSELEKIHAAKTGALFSAAAELGGITAGGDDENRARLSRFGLALGIAFQYADDRDDGDFVDLRDEAETRMKALTAEAKQLAGSFGDRGRILVAIAQWMESRA